MADQHSHNDSVWHAGELAVQERAGVGHVSGQGIHSSIPEGAARFLRQQQLAAFGSIDARGRVWASLHTGKPGFLDTLDEFTVQTSSLRVAGDPLLENLATNPAVGVVIIDLANRRRMRLNGDADVLANGSLRIHARQVYGNCPQYIQQRIAEGDPDASEGSGKLVSRKPELSKAQQKWIGSADTLFIASAHPESGVDASHRGGPPGFIHVESARRLLIPDYSGNKMFNTLGNITANPATGLVFPDFEQGRTLQLTGQARILWEFDRQRFPGAERLLEYSIEEVIEIEHPVHLHYIFKGYSPFNPK